MDLIYLDHAATTPLDPEIAQGLAERQLSLFGNPKSTHPAGRAAGAALAEARRSLARTVGARPEEIVFTGGGTEALVIALLGAVGDVSCRVCISAVEHSAVTESARVLERQGHVVDVVPVDAQGRVQPEALAEKLDPKTRVVALMMAQNEVGTLNDIPRLATVVRDRAPRARLVVDAVQALGKVPVDVVSMGADCVAFAAHKLHGPKGVGALWTRVALKPVLKGGGQEGNIRGGTQSAPLCWAFAAAAARHLPDMARLAGLRDRLWRGITARLPEAQLTGGPNGSGRLPHLLHLLLPGLPGEPVLNALSARGVCASAGSACGGGAFSRVLTAMGRRASDGAYLRLTPGRFTTEEEVDQAATLVAEAAAEVASTYG